MRTSRSRPPAGSSAAKRRKADRSAWRYALDALARRPLTGAELRKKLQKKKFSAEEIVGVVDRATELGLIDDRQVAYNHALFRAEQGRRGARRVLQELIARGVERSISEQAVLAAFPPEQEYESVLKSVRKATRGVEPVDRRDRERLARRLLRGGFAEHAVYRWLNEGPAERPADETDEWLDDRPNDRAIPGTADDGD